MSYQNILDRVPQEVLPNGAVRYGIYDTNGNLIRYEYIKREDEPIEEGTSINRSLFSNIQGDLYTQDRYNIPTVTYETIEGELDAVEGNIIPTTWEEIITPQLSYKSSDGFIVSGGGDNTTESVVKAVDGDYATYFRASGTKVWVQVEFPEPKYIYNFWLRVNANTSYFNSLSILGSKDGENWEVLLRSTSDTYISGGNYTPYLSKKDYYKFYKLEIVQTSSNVYASIYAFHVYSYGIPRIAPVNNLALPLSSYEVGKVVNIEQAPYEKAISGKIYMNINNLGVKLIVPDMVSGRRYSLVYDGVQWIFDYNYEVLNGNIITGTYTGNSTSANASQTIELGFDPKLLIVSNPERGYAMFVRGSFVGGANSGSGGSSASELSYHSNYGKISHAVGFERFQAFNGSTVTDYIGFNYSGVTYRYWAFR